ncbi:MAG: ribosome assembly RNA-binding protein YhbY [Burkholderiales bacterium]
MKLLNSSERSLLRARAHPLAPVVIIGNAGLTPGVIAEIERSLKAHDLIKIRVASAERAERQSMSESICVQTAAQLVQQIGKIVVIYREIPKEETTKKPAITRNKPDSGDAKKRHKPASREARRERSGANRFGDTRRPSTRRR